MPYSYFVGALICEYVYRGWGKEGLFDMMEHATEEEDIWAVLRKEGLGFGNINEKLDQLLADEPTLCLLENDFPNAEEGNVAE